MTEARLTENMIVPEDTKTIAAKKTKYKSVSRGFKIPIAFECLREADYSTREVGAP